MSKGHLGDIEPSTWGQDGRRGVVLKCRLGACGECCHGMHFGVRVRAAAAVAGVERDMRDE